MGNVDGLWRVGRSWTALPGPPGHDFYQLWLGARELAGGRSPYSEAVQWEMLTAYGEWGGHGLPYPVHQDTTSINCGLGLVNWPVAALLIAKPCNGKC